MIGATELTLGKILLTRTLTAANSTTVIAFLMELQERMAVRAPGHKYLLFLDNASIHRCDPVREYAAQNNIELVYNLSYRPDLNGIEGFWSVMKNHYRKEVGAVKALYNRWDQFELVK